MTSKARGKHSSKLLTSVDHKVDQGSDYFAGYVDSAHRSFDMFSHPFVRKIWQDKYRYLDELEPQDSFARVAKAIYQYDSHGHCQQAFEAMCLGLWMPGGRIIAGAGTAKRVTLNNCYVNKKLEDSLDDIMRGVTIAALTQQQGGGIGTDFSTLRPTGARLRRTGARASGPIPFMDMFDSMCATIMSAGDRRGAMMATMCDTHPDLLKFITCKRETNTLTNFNISILVSDAFMDAVKEDAEWLLYFDVPPLSKEDQIFGSFKDDENIQQFIYSKWGARDLWKMITENTYEYSEPGVIFIDRVNSLNNLKYIENIRCTNPCGEQPLPPNGTCNLGAVNLARMVLRPFTSEATFDFRLLRMITQLGQRFLDNVIDVAAYPLPEQEMEQKSKRRTGLGVSGLADALAQLGIRYGSSRAVELTDQVHYCQSQEAYATSCQLAVERGAFPTFDVNGYLGDGTFASIRCDHNIIAQIKKTGIRNSVLLTVAPTGTTSILFGNISSGVEPVFDHAPTRKVRQPDNTYKSHETLGYGAALYRAIQGIPKEVPTKDYTLPSYMVTTHDLSVEEHIAMQAAVQRWVDASVSKTVNVSKDLPYEQFVRVYDLAFSLGCKGCTTYRPSDVRGSILSIAENPKASSSSQIIPGQPMTRPDMLKGVTHKLKWPSMTAALYLTVNYTETGIPFEVFLASKDGRHHDWMTATSLMITAMLRKGGDCLFISDELQQVHSFGDTAFIQAPNDSHPRFYGSLPAYIGSVLGGYLRGATPTQALPLLKQPTILQERCPHCHTLGMEHKESCKTCNACGYTTCG